MDAEKVDFHDGKYRNCIKHEQAIFTMVHADESVGIWTPVTNDVLAMDWEIVEPMETSQESEKQPA